MTEAELNAAIALFRAETEDIIPAVLFQYYFNGGLPTRTPYTDTTEALSVIDTNWKPYMMVNVAGVDYWFLPDGSLVPYVGSVSLADKAVTMAKLADLAALSVIGNPTESTGVPQAITIAALKVLLDIPASVDISNLVEKEAGKVLIASTDLAKIHDKFATDEVAAIASIVASIESLADTLETLETNTAPNIFPIILPAATTVAGRLIGLVEGVNYPTGWVLTADGSDLVVTHNTGRSLVDVVVWSRNILLNRKELGNAAYSGLYESYTTVPNSFVIESLSTYEVEIHIKVILE